MLQGHTMVCLTVWTTAAIRVFSIAWKRKIHTLRKLYPVF